MATRYIPYYPNTLEGQARLDNFVRTNRMLFYKDNNQVKTRIQRGMPLYEVAERETVGKNEKDNLIMHGECLSTCAYLKEQGIEVDLVYIDPPFGMNIFTEALNFITDNGLIRDSGMIIVETPKGTPLPERIGKFMAKTKNYGQISLTAYKINEEEL